MGGFAPQTPGSAPADGERLPGIQMMQDAYNRGLEAGRREGYDVGLEEGNANATGGTNGGYPW